MGKNSKPLTICVNDDAIFNSPALQRFIQKGHKIVRGGFSDDWDVEIGSKCRRIDPRLRLGDDKSDDESLERQLEMMEAGIRAIKYPKEKKSEPQKETNNS